MTPTPFGIAFSEPYQSEDHTIRTGTGTDEFWSAWRAGRDTIKAQGFKVRKENNVWLVDWAIPETPEGPAYPPANPVLPLQNRLGLLAYQVPHAERLVAAMRRYGYALDASDAGTGKTYVAFAVARELGLTPAIVCPKSVIPAWERVGAFFGIRPYFVMNWEGCKSAKFAHGTLDQRTGDYFWKLGRTKILLVSDEVHKAGGEYTDNAKMLIAATRQKLPTLDLSATAADTPRRMRALGYNLGLHDLQNFRGWSQALGCYQMEYNGQARGWGCSDPVAAMGEIHRHLFPAKGSRMRIADLGDAFPDTQITADLYPISKTKLQNEAYHELLEAIEKLKREKKAGWAAAAMVLNLRYRQQAETLKVDLLTQLTKDYLESGLSVVVFVNFTKTLHELKDAFPSAAVIHGQQSSMERQAEIDRFQSDSTRVIVANIMAGGVGVSLHDLHGDQPRVALICPTYSAKDLKQALGRVHRANGKSKSLQRIIYAAGTVEEAVCKAVAKRLEAISSLNDGDLYEKDLLGVLGMDAAKIKEAQEVEHFQMRSIKASAKDDPEEVERRWKEGRFGTGENDAA